MTSVPIHWVLALVCLPLGVAAGSNVERVAIWLPRQMMQRWGEQPPPLPAPSTARLRLSQAIGAVIFALTALRWGFDPALAAALPATLTLMVLARIDWDWRLLPDVIVLPLLLAGLAVNLNDTFTSFRLSLLGAALGYAFPWLLATTYRLIRKRDGIGGGDIKLLAALGAWCGWPALPWIAALASILTAVAAAVPGPQGRGGLHPYGTYLAAAGWLALVLGT